VVCVLSLFGVVLRCSGFSIWSGLLRSVLALLFFVARSVARGLRRLRVMLCGWSCAAAAPLRVVMSSVLRLLSASVLTAALLMPGGPAMGQTSTVGGSIINSLEGAVWNAASQGGPLTVSPTAFEASFNSAVTDMVTTSVGDAGAAAVGGGVSLGAVALGGLAVAGVAVTYCMTMSTDACGIPGMSNGYPTFQPTPNNPFSSFDLQMATGMNYWYCQNSNGTGFCGTYLPDVAYQIANQIVQGAGAGCTMTGLVDRVGDLWDVTYSTSVPAGRCDGFIGGGDTQFVCCYTVDYDAPGGGVIVSPSDVFNVPSGDGGQMPEASWGTPPANNSPTISPFDISVPPGYGEGGAGSGPGAGLPTTGSGTSAGGTTSGGPGNFGPAGGNSTGTGGWTYPSNVLNEPASPVLIAELANDIAKLMESGTPGAEPLTLTLPSGGISPTAIAELIGQSSWPTIGQLFAPLYQGATEVTVVNGPNGTETTSVSLTGATGATGTAVSTGAATGTGLMTPGTSLTTTGPAPCGNMVVGELACGMTIEAEWYQWMDQESQEIAACSSTQTQTSLSTCVQTQISLMTRTEVAVQTQLQDQVDTKTSVTTVTQTLNPTQTPTETKLDDPVPLPTGTPPPNFPQITLPFDEWPGVIGQLPALNAALGAGQCPTVTFTSSILGNTTFTFGSQCLVMEALLPYMQYVMGAIYLVMALFLIMEA
jgi:hypothetical protein